jgi:hypothetical protein
MFAVNTHPAIMNGILVSLPIAITFSFLGLSLDEWPDAEANLKKGVKSIAFEVWKYTHEQGLVGLLAYCGTWLGFAMAFQVFLIAIGILAPMTGIAFIPLVLILPLSIKLVGNFRKWMFPVVIMAALYCIALLVGQVIK